MFFESHAHYDDPRYDGDRDALLAALPGQGGLPGHGVAYVVNVGADLPSSAASVALAEAYPFVYAAVGAHPHAVKTLSDSALAALETLCRHPRVVAVGEIGLDFYYDHSPREAQREWFRRQLGLAERVGLPVVIHSRKADQETYDILAASTVRRGVIHCFPGGPDLAEKYAALGFYLGVGGIVTFKNARKLVDVVCAQPLSRLLLETDCPYLAPEPKRGERNDSRNLTLVAEKIAALKGVTPEAVAAATLANGKKLFGIEECRT
jgi:TatD DNase family protein